MGKDLKGKEIGKGIRQRKDGTYEARFVNRFGTRKYVYSSTEKGIKQKFDDALFEDRSKKNVVDDSLTLDDWHKTWMEVYKEGDIRENTKRQYEHIYNAHISPYLGKMRLSDITTLQIKSLIRILAKDGYQFETQNKVRILICDMYNKAILDEMAIRNPAKGIKVVRDEEIERRVLSKEEQKMFFETAAGTFYNNLFCVAVMTGLRPGELFALTEKDLDFENMLITVDETLVYQKFDEDDKKKFHLGPPKTLESVRKVPMTEECAQYLKRQIIMSKSVKAKAKIRVKNFVESDYIFITTHGNPMNSQNFCDAIKRVVNEINMQRPMLEEMEKFSGHTFRYTFATRCIESGIQPKTLQKYLGHATLQMTMDLYVHVTEDFKREEIKKLNMPMFDGVQEW